MELHVCKKDRMDRDYSLHDTYLPTYLLTYLPTLNRLGKVSSERVFNVPASVLGGSLE